MSGSTYFNEVLEYLKAEANDAAARADADGLPPEDEDEVAVDDREGSPESVDEIFERYGRVDEPDLSDDQAAALDSLIPGPPTSADTFQSFFDRLAGVHFEAHELLIMGGNNASGPCAGTNRIPPKSMWPRIAPTIRALDSIRATLGYAILTNSVFRTPEYNQCLRDRLGSATAVHSQHTQFRAIDFRGASGNPTAWHNAVVAFDNANPGYGIWTKRYDTFVHIDTRGAS